MVLTMSSLFAQSNTITGIYARVENTAVNSTEFKEFSSKLKLRFPTISSFDAFPGGEASVLQNVKYYQLGNSSQYQALEAVLSEKSYFEEILVDDVVLGEGPSSSTSETRPEVSTVRTQQACSAPFVFNDPGSLSTEHLRTMELPCAWTLTQGNPNTVIGIVDNFFHPNHPDLAGRFANVTHCGSPPSSQASHGTASAGAVAGIVNNGLCVAGGAFDAQLDAYCWNNGILNAAWEASLQGRPIITLSAWSTSWERVNPMVRTCFEEIAERGSVVTYSVRGDNAINFSNIDGMIVVGMAYADGWFRTYDGGIPDLNIDMVVPSRNISRLTDVDCAIGPGNTSISSPYLAGIVSLMLSVNPCLTPQNIERLLKESSNEIPNPQNTFGQINGGGNVNAYAAVIAAQNYTGPENITVASGEYLVLTDENKAYGKIEILPGGRLDVNNSVVSIEGNSYGQSNDGRIVVHRGAKMVARNSIFTNPAIASCRKERWSGIRVHGNIDREQPNMFNANGELEVNTPIDIDDAGVVMLLDETIIQNATNAVATTVPGRSWQDQVDRWGGLVIADRAVFRDNFRAAEFLRYPRQFSGNTFKNKSVFNECTFITTDVADDRSLGITAWDTDGIKVTKSTFKNLGRESIVTIDGSFIVEDANNFINERGEPNHRHIMSMATYPYSGEMTIGNEDESVSRNKFRSGTEDDVFIYASTSSGSGGVLVYNNDFNGNRRLFANAYAVEIDGPSAYTVKGNLIEGSNPFLFNNTGMSNLIRDNVVTCNRINNTLGSMAFRGDNSGCQFRENIFSGLGSEGSIFSSPAISIDGDLDLDQGSASRPANNKFETTEQSVDILVQQGSTAFNYYYTDTGGPDDDVFEPRGESNYNKVFTISRGDSNCSSGKFQGVNIKEQDVLAAQNNYQNIRNSANPGVLEDMELLASAKANRDNLLNSYVGLALEEQNLGKINSLLTKIPDPEAKLRHFGACMKLGDHVGANSLLPTISAIGPVYNDFIDVQQINIERLQTTDEEFKLSETDYKTLDKVAKSESTSRGYARALLYLLKGKRYYDVYEQKLAIGLGEDGGVTTSSKSDSPLSVYPNPVLNGELRLIGSILDGDGTAVLRRMDGSVVSTTMFSNSKELIMVAPTITGIYFIQVTRGKENAVVKVIVK